MQHHQDYHREMLVFEAGARRYSPTRRRFGEMLIPAMDGEAIMPVAVANNRSRGAQVLRKVGIKSSAQFLI